MASKALSVGDVHTASYDSFFYIILPLFSTLGVIGNVISILILLRRPFQSSILYAYFLSLSVTDFLYLLLTLVHLIISLMK